ncbi:hypothetical protein QR680_019136 [Steinernema hermaphroditum]|uniref:K Homology domain-containing protein n=1 Tax=Steinernema hermaphroditum TaxID=289476 RepID=A0AA39HL21_9BILA|nr:hypothetical protein QR680_019136 [Steinernema hermaphroditum]
MRSNAVQRPPINGEMTAPEQIDEVAQKLAEVSRAPICRAARGEPDRTKSARKKTIKQRKKKASGERLDVEGGDAGVDEQNMDDVAAVLNWMCDCVAAHYELVVRPGAFTNREKAARGRSRAGEGDAAAEDEGTPNSTLNVADVKAPRRRGRKKKPRCILSAGGDQLNVEKKKPQKDNKTLPKRNPKKRADLPETHGRQRAQQVCRNRCTVFPNNSQDHQLENVKIHKRTIKIPIPEHPDGYKYIGRILGPRGISIRAMERDTGCKIAIRGRGSLKDPEQEELLRNCRGYKHLKENLHVRVTTEVDAGCSARLKAAEMLIRELLKPVDDNYKQEQMLQLSMINGTYRPGYSILQEVEDDSEWVES